MFTLSTDAGTGQIDQGTGVLLSWAELTPWQRVSETIYMLHTGQGAAVLGLILGLITLSVPVMGVTGALYANGFQYEDPANPYHMEGFVNSPGAVEALEVYKDLYKCCTPPGHSNAYMVENLDAYRSGQVAIQMNWFAFFPGILKDENVGGDKSGFFVNPAMSVEASALGGQGISVGAYPEKRDRALEYTRWFAPPDVQKKWGSLGGYSCHNAVLQDPGFAASAPFAADFLRAMSNVKDFWQEPTYAELLQAMQARIHDFVVADKGTAQEALDLLIADWTEVFEDDGKL